jgi:hypothetical protein
MYGARQRPSHLICGLCPSITDTSIALRFPHMLIIHAVLDHDVSLEGRGSLATGRCAFGDRVLAVAGQTRASDPVAGDGLPGVACSGAALTSSRSLLRVLETRNLK